MRARIRWTCQPKSKKADYGAEDIFIDVALPFVPQIGSKLKVTAHADFVAVGDVYLDLADGGEGLVVFLEDPDLGDPSFRPWLEMKREGWSLG